MGSVVFSIDAELGWGFHDRTDPPMDRIEAAQRGWQTLLDIFERYDVPTTWAVVGHSLLEECDCVHADHPSIDGWFESERGILKSRPDVRYGPDLVTAIAESTVDHDIGCHTFSHVVFDDPRLTREIVQAELETAIELAQSAGIEYDSFVFPRNEVGYRDVLAEYGFRCYRGADPEPPSRFKRITGKLLDTANPNRIRLVEPIVDEYGLVNIPPSMFLFGFEGAPRTAIETLGVDPIVRQAKHAIDRAARTDGLFHAWLHPNNLLTERDAERMRTIVEHTARRRERTDLEIETMSDVTERVLSVRKPAVRSP